MKQLSLFFCLIWVVVAQAQIKIGDNPQTIDPSSVLELESTSKVLVITRVNTAQMNAITPSIGALVYNTDVGCVHYYNGTAWVNICDAVAGSVTFGSEDGSILITPTGNDYDFKVGEITGDNIVDDTLTGDDIQNGSIVESNLADNSIGSIKLQDRTVTRLKIAYDAVGTFEIENNSITPEKLAIGTEVGQLMQWDGTNWILTLGTDLNVTEADGIVGNEVLDATLNGGLLRAGAGTELDPYTLGIAPNGVGTPHLADNSVTSDKIANGAVTDAKLDKDQIPLSGFGAAIANVDVGTQKLINVEDPTDPQDAATMAYVDQASTALSTLQNGNIYVGSTTNVASGVPMSGDATITNTGAVTITNEAVTTVKIANEAVTEAKLDKDQIPLSGFGAAIANVDVGTQKLINVEDPTDPQDAATMAYVDQASTALSTLQNGNIYVGSTTNVAAGVPMSGDATIDNSGAVTITNEAVTTAKIANEAVTEAKLDKDQIPLSGFGAATTDVDVGTQKLINVEDPTDPQDAATMAYVDQASTTLSTLQNGNIYVGSTTNVAAGVPMSGDATIDNSGAVTITNEAVTTAKLADDAVTTIKILDENVTPIKIEPSATIGQVLTTNATGQVEWAPTAPTGVATTTAMTGTGLTGAPLDLANNSVTSDKIINGTIIDEDISATAEIAGTKITPDFGALSVSTTGPLGAGNTTITGTLAISGQTTINAATTSTTLPIDRGTANQVLTTDGAGTATWTTPALAITGTTGSIFFADDDVSGTGALTQDNANLFWDTTNNRLGIGTNTPNSTLHTEGSFSTPIIITTADMTLDNTHYTVILNGNHDISLPVASTCIGRIYIIKNTTGTTPTISNYIDSDGAPTPTIGPGVTQLQSDGANWQQIN